MTTFESSFRRKSQSMNVANRLASAASRLTHPNYRPDIDGLRAVAILSVIGFHAFPNRLRGGFIGVDIFFVISGYLISTIVFGSLERGTFSIAEFYRRRVRRIFPALISVLLASAIFGWMVLLDDEYAQIGKHIAAASVFVQNFVLWHESGYVDNEAATKPLLHLWSLAIEEQFYIFWPLMLAFIWKRKWSFLYITLGLAVVSFATNIYFSENDPTADFYSPGSRFWELMVGGILAYIQLHRPELLKSNREAQSVLGFAFLAAGLIFINKGVAFPGWWALLPTLGAFFIISAGPTTWLNRNLLANRAMVGIGLISYPLYLWHWPLLSFAHIVHPHYNFKLALILVGVAVVLATATYRYIERPLRTASHPRTPLLLAAGMSVALVAGILIDRIPIEPRLYSASFKIPSKTEWDFLKSSTANFDANGTGIYSFHPERKDATVFIGDSQMAQYAERVDHVEDLDTNANGAVFAVGGGCPPINHVYTDDRSRRSCWRARDDAFRLAFDKRFSSVVIGGSWNWYFADAGFDGGYYFLKNGHRADLRSAIGTAEAFKTLYHFMARLKKAEKHVFLLLGNPIDYSFDPHVYFDRFVRTGSAPSNRFATYTLGQSQLRQRLIDLAKRAGVSIIDPYADLCKDVSCLRITKTGTAIFKDSSHFNPDWAIDHASYIDVALEHPQRRAIR